MQVYVRPFPDVGITRWQVSTDGGQMVRWSRDGRELLYMSDALDVVAVPVSLVPTFSMGAFRVLFRAEFNFLPLPFDVAADGRFLGPGESVRLGTFRTN